MSATATRARLQSEAAAVAAESSSTSSTSRYQHHSNYDLPSGQYGGIQGYVHRIGRTAVAPEKLAAENGAMVLALLVMERLG